MAMWEGWAMFVQVSLRIYSSLSIYLEIGIDSGGRQLVDELA